MTFPGATPNPALVRTRMIGKTDQGNVFEQRAHHTRHGRGERIDIAQPLHQRLDLRDGAIEADAGLDKFGTGKLLLERGLQLRVERRQGFSNCIAFLVEAGHRKRGHNGENNKGERRLPRNKRRQRDVNESDDSAAKE